MSFHQPLSPQGMRSAMLFLFDEKRVAMDNGGFVFLFSLALGRLGPFVKASPRGILELTLARFPSGCHRLCVLATEASERVLPQDGGAGHLHQPTRPLLLPRRQQDR